MLDTLQRLLAAQFRVPQARITQKTRLREDLGADSVDKMALLIALEAALNLELSYRALKELRTVGQLEEMLLQKSNRGLLPH